MSGRLVSHFTVILFSSLVLGLYLSGRILYETGMLILVIEGLIVLGDIRYELQKGRR